MNTLLTNKKDDNFYNHLKQSLLSCKSFTFNVAFINFSGLQLLLDTFKVLEQKGIKGKILTSTYLNFTETKALEKILEFPNIEIKVFDSNATNIGFHSKAYIFEYEEDYKIILGSSNITASAFKKNIEWNVKTICKKDNDYLESIKSEFNLLWKDSFYINEEFLKEYKSFQEKNINKSFTFNKSIKKNHMQKQALENLEFLRQKGENKALCIASTGSGKTYLAAFDVKAFNANRVLFIVHRENILIKAKESFEALIENKSFGFFTGNKKQLDKDYIFASIQSLHNNLELFKKEHFDYIIYDEAHHICSPSYLKALEYFEPKFILGLTATPNRMDDLSIYEVFENNIACDIRLSHALEHNLVSSFHYYGISDIKEISYDMKDLNNISLLAKKLMLNKRVDFIIEKMNFYSYMGYKRRALGFCISKEHAIFMKEQFNKKAINSEVLLSSDSISKREEIIKNLEDKDNKLEVIFCVDIFNEGLDIPLLNTVLMLRPTASSIVFTQQLGRGLRKHKNKDFLTVIDFIGNHERSYLVALALLGDKTIDKDSIKLALNNNYASLDNAFISMDEISKKAILESLEKENFSSFKYLKEKYLSFKNSINKTPRLSDFILDEEYISALDFINESKSYVEFQNRVEKDKNISLLLDDKSFVKTLRFIEFFLPIKRVYEFVILLYLCENEKISEQKAFDILSKYLINVCRNTIKHSFMYLNQNFLDKAQVSRYEKILSLENNYLKRTKSFSSILKNENKKALIKDSLEYGIISYENSFSNKDYSYPFFKLYEKYNMLNIALLCNFNKIHSSFRGSGFLKYENNFFLFITLEKDKFSKASLYKNNFLNKKEFIYFSKPTHTPNKSDGYKLCYNKKENVNLHIFVRKSAKLDNKTQGFIYLGKANTISYEGEKPIKCILSLENALNDNLYEEFTKVIF